MKKEKKIKNSTDPVSISCTEKILNQMRHSICKIKIQGANATGFFCRTQFEQNENIDFLMTNYHVIDGKYCEENKEINLLLNDDTEALVIDLTIKRRMYFNKDFDIALIELKEIDKVENFLELDDNLFKGNEKIFYEEKSVYVLQYPNGRIACVSYGLLININNYDVTHTCSTENGSSGSPILNLENNKVIGIHKEGSTIFNFNLGTFLRYPLEDFIEKNLNKGIKKKEKKVEDDEDNRINNELNLPKIPDKNIKPSKKKNNNINAEKIKLDSIVIWIDKYLDNEQNKQFVDILESIFELNLGLFKDIHSAFHYMNSIQFKETKIIISGSYYKEFINKFKERLTDIYFAPKIIVFTGNCQKFFTYNKEYNNKENIFYTFGGVVDKFEGIIQFLKGENQIDKNIEPPKFLEKEPLAFLNKPEQEGYAFYYLDNKDKKSLPIVFKSLLDKTSTDNLENYTLFLNNNFSNKCLDSIIYIKNIPIEILSKYYARLYTEESKASFYKNINNELRSGKIEKNLPFIKTLYEGIKSKSLPLSNENVLYRASIISLDEIKKIEECFEKKDLISLIVFSKTFLSFGNKNVAEMFLKHSKIYNANKNIFQALFIIEKDDKNNYDYCTYCDLEGISFYKEKEILFLPFSAFKIKDLKQSYKEGDIIYEIRLTYIGKYLNNI